MWSPTHVQVTVQRARNLQNKGRKGTNDAFVLIQMGKEKFQTTVKEKATEPEWYEECDLTLIGRDSDVQLTVFHRNVLGLEEFLGQTSVSLQGIESYDRPFTRWYTLKGKSEKSEEKNRGDLEVRVAFIVRRCNDTQSLNDLSIKKKKHSIKNLAASVGHKIQKLPSRSVSLRNLNPQKHLQRLRDKRASTTSDPGAAEINDENSQDMFPHMLMKRNSSLYSSTLSLPQSTLYPDPIEEADSEGEEGRCFSNSSESIDSQNSNIPKPPPRKNNLQIMSHEAKILNHGEWTNRILSHSKESPIARSETNLLDAIRSESPIQPSRSKLENLKNLRRHTLQLAESPNLPMRPRIQSQQKMNVEAFLSNGFLKKDKSALLEGIPAEVKQQFGKMNHDDLVLLAVKQQGDLERQRDKIVDLENYLDNLLVRVMETTPRILQKPYVNHACQR